jgi:hypothetical protein
VATTVTKQVIENGNRNYIATYMISSDGSAYAATAQLDPTSGGDMGVIYGGNTLYPGTHLKIWRLAYNLPVGMNARLIWEATSAQDAWDMYGFGKQEWKFHGGLYVPQSSGAPIAGATGKIDLAVAAYTLPTGTTTAFGSIEVWAKKDIAR